MNYVDELKYEKDSLYCPIPANEQLLQTVIAKPWLKVDCERNNDLEGVSFDKDGNLLFVESVTSRLHCVKTDTDSPVDNILYKDKEERSMSSSKPFKDGRIFIPSVGPTFDRGYVFALTPDTGDYELLMAGHVFDDLTFDKDGGFYYTHFWGDVNDPSGGVYYVYPDHKTVVPFLPHLCGPNGVAVSNDGKVVWITETTAGRLLRVGLTGNGPTDIKPFGVEAVYKFTGGAGPDSCEIDMDDNLYVAMYNQGRVMIFNPNGFPIGQILMKGLEDGKNRQLTHAMVKPGTKDLYICTNDPVDGATIFKAKAFAEGRPVWP